METRVPGRHSTEDSRNVNHAEAKKAAVGEEILPTEWFVNLPVTGEESCLNR